MSCKAEIRKELLQKRKGLSKERREEAAQQATEKLLKKLAGFPYVLSFASKVEEIDLWPLNKILAKEGRLFLPRLLFRNPIGAYKVRNFEEELLLHPKWNFLEPNPKRCTPFPTKHLSVVLVPGVGFDRQNGRVGFGKGYYDRFLASLSCPFWGIGFKEQLTDTPIPHEAHDVFLTELHLF